MRYGVIGKAWSEVAAEATAADADFRTLALRTRGARCSSAALSLALDVGPAAAGDAAAGKKVFKKCVVCHTLKKGKNKVGPSLFGVDRPPGRHRRQVQVFVLH